MQLFIQSTSPRSEDTRYHLQLMANTCKYSGLINPLEIESKKNLVMSSKLLRHILVCLKESGYYQKEKKVHVHYYRRDTPGIKLTTFW